MKNKKVYIIISIIIAIGIVLGTIRLIPYFTLKEVTAKSQEGKQVILGTGNIEIKKGETLIGETESKELYLDTDTLDIRVVDKKTKSEWESKIEKTSNDKEKSIVNIGYLNESQIFQEWSAYKDVIVPGNYDIEQIENGAKLTLKFETTTKKAEQLLPTYLSKEYLKSAFYDQIDKKVDEGKLEESAGTNYKNILSRIYVGSLSKDGLTIVETMPPSALKIVNEMVVDIDYTEEMLKKDNEESGFDIEIPQIASFRIVVNVYLDGDDLIINIPIEEAISNNEYFELQYIEAYSGFGYASSEKVKEGYIMVPDGAGALLDLNSYDVSYPQYKRPIYNNTFYDQMYTMSNFNENIQMPVFGMTYGKNESATHGFMGIVESGEEVSSINVQLGTDDISTGGNVNNKVYPSVEVMQFSRVKLLGPYTKDESRYLASTGKFDMEYTVRYKFFDKGVTYYDMANSYKDYLIERYSLTENYSNEAKMYINMIGALTIPARVVGVPYDKTISMTNYEQALNIVKELNGMNLVFNYEDMFFGGKNSKIKSDSSIVSENGSKEQLDELISTISEQQNELFLGVSMLGVQDASYPFNPKIHGAYNYDSKPIEIYDYNYSTGKFWPNFTPEYIIHPKFLKGIVDEFIAETEKYKNISIEDLPGTYYASYKEDDVLSPIMANNMIEEELKKLEENKVLAFNNPNANTLPYADYVYNISRESSNYASIVSNIPFRQLVLNGLVQYTTLDVNMSKESIEYFLLQALEVGSYPKFTISAENEDILQDSQYREYLSTHYNTIKLQIEELYAKYSEAFEQIGTNEIINHKQLEDKVFETEYANGIRVIVNYSYDPVQIDGHMVDGIGYKIVNN